MDLVLVVFAAVNPDPHLRAVDRYLIIAEANGLAAELVGQYLQVKRRQLL